MALRRAKRKRENIVDLSRIFVMPTLEPSRQHNRMVSMERDLVLPVKFVLITYLFFDVFYAEWVWDPIITREFIQVSTLQTYFFAYAAANLIGARYILAAKSIPLNRLRPLVIAYAVLDILMLAVLTFITDGFSSSVFWMFLALVVRNALSVPMMLPQIILQIVTNLSFLSAGLLNVWVSNLDSEFMPESIANEFAGVGPMDAFVRVILLAVMTICIYAVQVLFERQRLVQEEGQEFALRNEQVKTAGRLAGEIAHQIKNPLSIINNTAWSLKRSLKDSDSAAAEQIDIIREEVERSDRILTELMGYARLADGNVERLDVNEELDACIETTFPSGAGFETRVVKRYQRDLPSLLMQQGHLREIFSNLLQNARDAMDNKGEVRVTTSQDSDDAIIVVVEDVGSGIDPEKLEQVFEAYFTTKPRGTGLGLAIVRNNIELYGGSIHAESELGHGSRFILRFPPRAPRN